MAEREKSSEIEDAAVVWAVRLDRGLLSPEEFEALQAWLERDSRCLGALARAQAVLSTMSRAKGLGPLYDPSQFQSATAPDPRRRMFLRAGLVAGALVGLGVVGRAASRFLPDHFQTAQGQIRIQPLPDGSVVTLNTATEISARFSKGRRDIRLFRGEALFDVAKDAARPFVVRMGAIEVRAVGTSFALRRLPEKDMEILVQEGVVEVDPGQSFASGLTPVRRAEANTKIIAPHGSGMIVTRLSPEELRKRLSWQEGMISFNATSLREAAAEFARYSEFKITINDPLIANRTVTGLFSAFNPGGFAKAVAVSLGLKLELRADQAILSD